MFRIVLGAGLLLAAPAFANCSACHSLDYVKMNAPFLTEAVWKAEVAKMRTVFGSPIDDAVAAEIVQYLTAQYGPKK